MELLEKLLVDLHSSIEGEDLQIDPVSLVANIEATALAEMDLADLEYTTTLIFQSSSPPSMLMFLVDSSRAKDKEIITAKKHALKFMALFVKVMPFMVDKFSVEILKTLIELFKKETSGDVKSCLLLPVKNLLRRAYKTEGGGSVPDGTSLMSAEDVDLELIYRVLMTELNQSASKLGKGLRCEGLKTLGLLVSYFPTEPGTVQVMDSLLSLCENNLASNFSKTCKEPDFSAIAGSFSCLDRCLSHFEDRYAGSAALWKYLLQAVMATTQADTSRYAASSKAVRLISHHAELFQSLIGLNASQSYNLLYQMYVAEKKAMAKHSANALYTVLRQIGLFVVANRGKADSSDAVRTVLRLYTDFMSILEHGTAGGGANNSNKTNIKNSENSNSSSSSSAGGSGEEQREQQEGLMHAVQGLAAIAPALVSIATSSSASSSTTSTGASSQQQLSIPGTVQSIVEAAHHFVRYQDSLAIMTADDQGGAGSAQGSAAGTAAEAVVTAVVGTTNTEAIAAEGAQDESAGQQEGYENIAFKHKKVLFFMAVTSFISAASTTTATTAAAGAEPATAVLKFSPGLVQFLEQYLVDAVVTYSRFWSKQQAQVCQALCTLMHALIRLQHQHQITDSEVYVVSTASTSSTSSREEVAPAGVFSRLLDCLTSALLVRTLSRLSHSESINPAQTRLSLYTGESEDRLLFAYLDLWTELLYPKDKHIRALLMRFYAPSYETHFAQRLYAGLLEQVLHLLGTLDLSYVFISNGVAGDEGGSGADAAADRVLVPSNIADQDVLLNLVAFLEALLPSGEDWFPGSLIAWLPLLVQRVVLLCNEHPLLSALYRLLTCALRVVDGAFTFTVQDSAGDGAGAGVTDVLVEVNTTGATASNALVPHQQHQHKHQQAATGPPQLLTCASGLRVLMLALQERVASSAAEFQQELLDAVLCLILSSPRRILPLSDVISTVRLSLVTGVQALQAVQVLSHQLLADKEALMPHLASLLPLFDKYLSGASSAAGGAGDEKDKLFLRSAAALSKMTKKSKTAAKSTSTTAAEESGMEGAPYAVQVQYALLRFLGRLGGASQQILVPASQTVQGSLVWSDKECVCIDLPAAAPAGAGGARGVQATAQTQAHLRLCLDVVLPRIISLCDASSSGTVDPQALSAAAEALHAMVLYMVGTASAVANARAKNTHFSALYERIFPTVIRLSVTDFLCRGLFEKLLFQLIRWFSGHGQVSDRDAGALLDALFSRLGDPSSEGTEREMSARGVLEFFQWAVKQTTKGELAKHPGSVESIMERVCLLIGHPIESQRTAAVAVLRKIYASLREESSLVGKYVLRVIYLLTKSMCLFESESIQQDIAGVLLKFEGMVVVTVTSKDDIADLLRPVEERGYPQSLQELVQLELWSGALTSTKLQHRRQCMRSFSALAPLLQLRGGAGAAGALVGAKTFLQGLAARDASCGGSLRNLVTSAIERTLLPAAMPSTAISTSTSGAAELELSPAVDPSQRMAEQSEWLYALNARIDAYNWLIKMDFLTAEELFLSDDPAGGASAPTTAAGKKRKASKDDEGIATTATASNLFQCLADFVTTYQSQEELLSTIPVDLQTESVLLKLVAVRKECLYRTLLLLSNALSSTAASTSTGNAAAGTVSKQAELLLAKSLVWGPELHRAVVATLLPVLQPGKDSSGSATASSGGADGPSIAFAVERLYSQAASLLPDSSKISGSDGFGRVFAQAAGQYINLILDNVSSGQLSRIAASVSAQLRLLKNFYRTVKECSLLPAVFGASHAVENRRFSASVLQSVLEAIAQGSDPQDVGTSLTTADGKSSAGDEGSAVSPAVLDLGTTALDLAVELGLTLLSPVTTTTDVSLLDLLQHPQHGAVLLEHYRDRVLDVLTGTNTVLSLVQRANLEAFVAQAFTVQPAVGQTAVHLRTVFPLALSALTTGAQVQSNDLVSVIVEVCGANAAIFATLPDNVVLLLLEACSQSSQTGAFSAGSSLCLVGVITFKQHVLNKCLASFGAPVSTAATKGADVDAMVTRLHWLPYLLEGTVEGAPNPYTALHSTAAAAGSTKQQQDQDTAKQKLVEALDELAADRFPLQSRSLPSSSPEGRHYFKLLRAYLKAFTQCGSVLLLGPLIPSLREGAKHKYYGLITAAFRAVTSTVSVDPIAVADADGSGGAGGSAVVVQQQQQMYIAVRVLASYCSKQILDEYQDQSVKHILFQHLLVPTLMRCPAAALIHIFTATAASTASMHPDMQFQFGDPSAATAGDASVVKQLCDTIARDPHAVLKKSGSDAAAALVYVQSCAYRMLEVLFDRCSLTSVKTAVNQAFAGVTGAAAESLKGNELTMTVCKAAHKQLRAPKLPTDCVPTDLATALYCAAYRCLTIAVAKTQAGEQFFDMFLFTEKAGEEVWERMIGECILSEDGKVVNPNIFSAASGKFSTVAIGSTGEGEFGDAQMAAEFYAQRRQRQQLLRARQAASSAVGGRSFLSQYLAGSVMESSSASQAYHSGGGGGGGNSRNSNCGGGGSQGGGTLSLADMGEGYTVSQYDYLLNKKSGAAAGGVGGESAAAIADSAYNASQVQGYIQHAADGIVTRADAVQGLDDQVIYLELNDLNRVPAMGCLVRAIQRMEVLFRPKWEATRFSELDLPKWLAECRDKLSDVSSTGQSANVRLFVLRLLMNEPVASIVSPWVVHLLPALLNCALYDLCGIEVGGGNTGGSAGAGASAASSLSSGTAKAGYPRFSSRGGKGYCYSYMLRDLVFALCDVWKEAVPSTYSQEQASLLVNYLLEHAFDADQNILKENVLSIKGLISQWIPVPSSGAGNSGGSAATSSAAVTTLPPPLQLRLHPIIELMMTAHNPTGGAHGAASSRGTEGVRRRLAGLDILKHLLHCQYPLLEAAKSVQCGGSHLLGAVLDCVKYPRKEVIESSCEVAGMLLREIARYAENNRAHLLVPEHDKFQSSLAALLEQKLLQKGGNDIVATCLRAVTVRFPLFLSRDLLMKTVYNVVRLSPRSKYEYLEMLCRTDSLASFEGLSLLNDVLRPHILPFLADLSTVVFGRGRYSIRLPMVQINMLLLIRKHMAELRWELIENILGNSATEGLMLCVSPQSLLQVRHAAYQALLALWHLRLSPAGSGDGDVETDAERTSALRCRVCQLLLNGLRDKDTVGMNEQVADASSSGTDGGGTGSVLLNPSSDIRGTRYDDPKYWADDNVTRVGIRRQLFNFFEAEVQQDGYGLSASYSQRLHSLMSELFDASQHQQWLQYSSFLILSVSRRYPAFSALLFQHSLTDASSFTPLEIKQGRLSGGGSGGDSLSSLTPLFSLERTTQAITQSLQQSQLVGALSQANVQATQSFLSSQPGREKTGTQSVDSWSERRAGFIRGTQQFSWTQTQQLEPGGVGGASGPGRRQISSGDGGAGAGRQRSGAFVDTSSTQFSAFGAGVRVPASSLSYSSGVPTATASSAGTAGASAGTGAGAVSTSMGPPMGLPSRYVTTQRVPIRFSHKGSGGGADDTSGGGGSAGGGNQYSTGASLVSRAAKYATVAAMQASSKVADQRRIRDKHSGGKGKVVVYRKYRQGELPDIAIRCSDILQPLQSLCLLDDVTAGLMFGCVFDTLYVSPVNAGGSGVMCSDLLSMLQTVRSAGATSSNLCASLLRRSTFSLQQCIAHSRNQDALTTSKPARGGGRGAKTTATTSATVSATIAPDLLLPAELVAECAIQSSNYHSGIQVLEEQLSVLRQVPHLVVAAAATAPTNNDAMQAATVAPAPAVGRKRNIQATADYSDSEASQASVSAPASAGTTSKRARSSATASAASSSAAATASALLTTSKGKSKASSSKAGGGRKKSAKTESADPDDDDAASQQSQQDAAAITAGEEGDAPTQQLEELTAEEMFAQMDAEEAPSSRRGAKSGAQKSTAAAASSAADSTKLSAGQSAVLQRQRRNIWHQLYRLYDRLGEKDVLVGLTARLSEDASTTTTCSTSTTEVDAAEDALVVAGTVQGRAELTRRALDAELSGDFQEAVRIYASLNEASDQEEAAGDGEAESDVLHIAGISQEERNLWDERSLLCLRQLTDWQQLYDCVDKVARISLHDSADPDAMQPAEEPRLWEVLSGLDSRSERQNRLKEQVIPHYLQSLLHLGCPYSESPVAVAENERNTQERDAFIERVLSYQSTTVSTSKDAARTASQYELRQYIENTFPIELATAFASKGQWARTRLYCEQAHQRFLSQWSSLHPCATEARRQLLTQLQPILELRDAADFYSAAGISGGIGGAGGGGFGGGGGGAFTDRSRKQLISLVGKWEVTEPSIADATAHWANVTCNRHISLNSALQSAPVAGGACEGAAAVLRAAKVQLASMHVKTAAAAVHQGVLTAVKTQLEINNAIRRSVFGKKAILTMPEVRVVYDYNSRSIARLLDSASTSTSTSSTAGAGDVAVQVEGMFQKTMGLLDKKVELLQEHRRSLDPTSLQILGSAGSTGRDTEALDTLHLMILRANWLVKWASCITNTTSSGGATSSEETGRAFRQRTLDALTLYKECSAGAAAASHQTSAAAATAATSTTTRAQLNSLQNQLCTSFTLHCDNLLQCFESAHAAGGSTDAATASLAQEFLVQEHASKKDARAQAAVLTVQSFVQGLRLGNGYCIQRVLRLVQIIGAYPEETEHILRSQLASLPAWVFLQFAAQLMGSLDRPEGAIICSLLEHTAAAFPTALYYPFRITSEFLGVKGRERSAKLGLMLRNSSQDAFIEALNGLTHPEHRWNDGMKEIHQIFLGATGASAAAVDEGTKLRVAAAYQKLRRCTLETDWLSVGGKIGTYNRKWARSARPIADKFAGAQGEKLVSKKAFDALRQAIINADLCEITQHGGGKVALSEFSQWLCDFDPLTCHIEIPGQYSNMSAAAAATAGGGDSVCYGAPRAAVHEAIVAVDPSLLAMSSIRKPKRIKLYGSAGGQHYFLVKGGEDLRNDERVQQLFHLMNTVVAAGMDSNVKQQQAQASCAGSLKARTYAVIPMTSQLGVLEWVSNTTPLKCILSEEMGRDAALCAANPDAVRTQSDGSTEVDLFGLNAYKARLKWINNSHHYQDYHKMIRSANRAQATAVYESITATLPCDFIRRRFQALALTAEAFITIRSEFAQTLAVSSLFGYILGLGDRHLENLLIDLTTGAVVQIDFGICFGMGSSVLQVPELLPFRLTPQLRAVLQPLDGVGLLRHYMMQCLQALRADASATGLTPPYSGDAASGSVGVKAGGGKAKGSKAAAAEHAVTADQPPESYSGIIPNALEVYLNDPVVDWLKGTSSNKGGKSVISKAAATSSASSASAAAAVDPDASAAASMREEWTERREDMCWEPRRRVHIAVQKLRGADPAQVLLTDLQMNVHVEREKSLPALRTIITTAAAGGSVSAGTGGKVEANAGQEVLGVGEQVDRLINIATDPDVLVRQWGGLQTWL